MANEYLKPQIPLKDLNSENYFYPLTTLDQVQKTDGSRVQEYELGNVVAEEGEEIISNPEASEISALMNAVYPIGSIYMSVNATSPAILFGGTWEALGGRFLIGANENYTGGDTGGSANAIIPYHNHNFTGTTVTSGNQSANHTHSGTTGNQSANHTHSGTTGNQSANHTHSGTTATAVAGSGGIRAVGTVGTNVHAGHVTGYSAGSYTQINAGAAFNGSNHTHTFTTTTNSANHTHTFTTTTNSANHTHTFTTGNNSGNHTHQVTAAGTISYAGENNNIIGANMPPYLAVYMWKRIN